jgi:NADPH2:quinone reductase
MRAIRVERHGGPEALELAEVDAPRPGPGQVLVDVTAAGVNFIDTYQRSGVYPVPVPFVPGGEGAGVVSALGEGVATVRPGDHVAWLAPASYAQQTVVSADRVIPLPSGISDEVAAAVLLQGMTAHYLTTSTYEVQPGDAVLVHAAAGGVGLLLTQMVKRQGGRVIATVSSEEKAALARAAGADEVIRYDQVEFAPEVRRLTGGEGVAVAYDGVGKSTFDGSLASLRVRGMMALYGGASGQVPPFDPQRLNSGGSLFLTRPTLVHYSARREELLSRAGDLFGWIAAGQLDVRIGGRYPLAEAGRAHDDLESRRTTGKLILLTD